MLGQGITGALCIAMQRILVIEEGEDSFSSGRFARLAFEQRSRHRKKTYREQRNEKPACNVRLVRRHTGGAT